ncbi:hypothetical protein INT46_003664 [Mucor plumbeus]|uniref:Uncharacterized protein n=1 Tax=Mucor plumbeus TaxID=97098 RepID=A0A8H7RDR2_9FUNG|nr:hypothetical protein INT46_003664 [Mucor plumbeus]
MENHNHSILTIRLGCRFVEGDMEYNNYTVNSWLKWGFSDETRINMWGSDGKSYYWTDGATELLLHQIEPHVQGDGGSVLFWGLITAEGPGYVLYSTKYYTLSTSITNQ